VCPVCETGRRAPDPPARSGERGEEGPASDGRGDSRPRAAAAVRRGEPARVGRARSGHIPGAFCIGPRPVALLACGYPIEDRVLARRGSLSCSGASNSPSVAVAGPPHQSGAASGSRPDGRAPSRAGWWLRVRAGFSARARRSAQGAFPPRACLLYPRLRRCPRRGAPPSCDSRWNAKESAGEAPRLPVAHAPSPSFHGSRGISAGVLCTRARAAFQCLATLPVAPRTPLPHI
jgi:hypothetical protein